MDIVLVPCGFNAFPCLLILLGIGGGVKAEDHSVTVKAKDWHSWSFRPEVNDPITWDIRTDGPPVDVYLTVSPAYSGLQDAVARGEDLGIGQQYLIKQAAVSHSSMNYTVTGQELDPHAGDPSWIVAVYNPNGTEVVLTYKVEVNGVEVEDNDVAIPIIPVLGALLLLGLIRRRQSKS